MAVLPSTTSSVSCARSQSRRASVDSIFVVGLLINSSGVRGKLLFELVELTLFRLATFSLESSCIATGEWKSVQLSLPVLTLCTHSYPSLSERKPLRCRCKSFGMYCSRCPGETQWMQGYRAEDYVARVRRTQFVLSSADRLEPLTSAIVQLESHYRTQGLEDSQHRRRKHAVRSR